MFVNFGGRGRVSFITFCFPPFGATWFEIFGSGPHFFFGFPSGEFGGELLLFGVATKGDGTTPEFVSFVLGGGVAITIMGRTRVNWFSFFMFTRGGALGCRCDGVSSCAVDIGGHRGYLCTVVPLWIVGTFIFR